MGLNIEPKFKRACNHLFLLVFTSRHPRLSPIALATIAITGSELGASSPRRTSTPRSRYTPPTVGSWLDWCFHTPWVRFASNDSKAFDFSGSGSLWDRWGRDRWSGSLLLSSVRLSVGRRMGDAGGRASVLKRRLILGN